MKLRRILHIILLIVLFFGVATYMVYAMVEFRNGNPNEVCSDVRIEIEGDSHNAFLTPDQVREMLEKAGVYPKGQPMRNVNTRRMEEALRHNTFIEDVECFKVPTSSEDVNKGRVCVKVTLRQPVIFILPDGEEGYYVDEQGMVIPNSAYSRNIVIATGRVTRRYASESLASFGTYLRENPFWDQQIEQIHVGRDASGQTVVTLIPRIGEQTIYLGTLDKYEQKLRRLRIFYQKGCPEFGWNKYSYLNLEFDNQIICTK